MIYFVTSIFVLPILFMIWIMIKARQYQNDYHKYGMENDAYSDCCDAPMNTDLQRCSECGEWCEPSIDDI